MIREVIVDGRQVLSPGRFRNIVWLLLGVGPIVLFVWEIWEPKVYSIYAFGKFQCVRPDLHIVLCSARHCGHVRCTLARRTQKQKLWISVNWRVSFPNSWCGREKFPCSFSMRLCPGMEDQRSTRFPRGIVIMSPGPKHPTNTRPCGKAALVICGSTWHRWCSLNSVLVVDVVFTSTTGVGVQIVSITFSVKGVATALECGGTDFPSDRNASRLQRSAGDELLL